MLPVLSGVCDGAALHINVNLRLPLVSRSLTAFGEKGEKIAAQRITPDRLSVCAGRLGLPNPDLFAASP
jgi:hypothetical protein